MRIGLLILILCMISSTHADIYKWTDADGVVHFSDQAQPGADKIPLPQAPTFNPPSNSQTPNPLPPSPSVTSDSGSSAVTYDSIQIMQPQPESTIRNNQGYVPIIVEISPDLRKGDKLQLLLDGIVLGQAQTSLLFALNNVNRGAHKIVVQVLDENNNVLNSSDAVTFYMQRPRVGMVKNNPGSN